MSKYAEHVRALRMDGNAAQSAARVTADTSYRNSLVRLSLIDHAAAELLVQHEDGRINLHEMADSRALVVHALEGVGYEFDVNQVTEDEKRHLGPYNVWHGGKRDDCLACQRVRVV